MTIYNVSVIPRFQHVTMWDDGDEGHWHFWVKQIEGLRMLTGAHTDLSFNGSQVACGVIPPLLMSKPNPHCKASVMPAAVVISLALSFLWFSACFLVKKKKLVLGSVGESVWYLHVSLVFLSRDKDALNWPTTIIQKDGLYNTDTFAWALTISGADHVKFVFTVKPEKRPWGL